MKRAVIYARYSSDKQDEQSIEGQLTVCEKWASDNGYIIVDTYIDRARSGRNDRRVEFQRLMAESVHRQWEAVIVYKGDRFARNRRDAQNYKKRLKDNGVRVISATEYIPESPEGILMESLLEGMAEYYSAELGQKVKRGRTESYKKGHFTGGKVPFGIKIVDKKYLIHEAEAELMREIYHRIGQGDTAKAIYLDFARRGVRNKRGEPITQSNIYKIMRSTYADGRVIVDDHIVAVLPEIVPKEDRDAVDAVIAQNKKAPARKRTESPYLLSGKVVCGECGSPMIGECGTSKTGAIYHYYVCVDHRRRKGCDLQAIRRADLEQSVYDVIKGVFTPETIDKVADRLYKKLSSENPYAAEARMYEERKKAAQKKLDALMQAIYAGILSPTMQSQFNEAEGEVALCDSKIEELSAHKPMGRMRIKSSLMAFLDSNNPQFVDRIIRNLVRSVVVYHDKIVVVFSVPDGTDPSRKTAVTREVAHTIYSELENPVESSDIFADGSPTVKKPNTSILVFTAFWCAAARRWD